MGTLSVTVPGTSDPNKASGETKHMDHFPRPPTALHTSTPSMTADPFKKDSLCASLDPRNNPVRL